VFEALGCAIDDAAPDFSGANEAFMINRAVGFATSRYSLLKAHRDQLKELYFAVLANAMSPGGYDARATTTAGAGAAARSKSASAAKPAKTSAAAGGAVERAHLEDAFNRNITAKVKSWVERELSDRNEGSRAGGGGGGGGGAGGGAGGAARLRRRNQVTVKDYRRLQCAVIIVEINKLLISRSSVQLQGLATSLDTAAQQIEIAADAAAFASATAAGSLGGGDPLSTMANTIGSSATGDRASIFTSFITVLTSRAVCQRDDSDRTASYIIPESSLALALDTVGQRLASWQSQVVADISNTTEALLAQQLTQQTALHATIDHLQYAREVNRKALSRRVQTVVADTQYDLMFQNDALRKENKALLARIHNQENNVRQQVRLEYEEKVAELQRQLLLTQGQYKSYQKRLYRDMQVSLEEIKRNAMLSVGRMESAPLHMKRQALKIAISDDELNTLKDQNNELRQTIVKTKLWFEMKALRMKAAFEKRMHVTLKEADDSRAMFWGNKEIVDREKDTLRQQLVASQSQLSQAEIEVDQLRRDLQVQLTHKKDLVSWKVQHTRVIDELKKKVKRYEKFGQADLEKILSEHERRQQEQQLGASSAVSAQRNTGSAVRVRSAGGGATSPRAVLAKDHERDVAKLRERVDAEKVLKERAFAKVDELRRAHPDATESLVWQRKYYEAASELQRASRDIEKLRTTGGGLTQEGGDLGDMGTPTRGPSVMRTFHSAAPSASRGASAPGAARPPPSRLGTANSLPSRAMTSQGVRR
jgi:hypothetical protein